jgi:hypothetical protein
MSGDLVDLAALDAAQLDKGFGEKGSTPARDSG